MVCSLDVSNRFSGRETAMSTQEGLPFFEELFP